VTAVASRRFTVRVMVTDTWDQVELPVSEDTGVDELKRRALDEALGGRPVDPGDYVVKFRGAAILDEGVTLGALGVGANAPFIVLPRRRQPVR
jgi:hypothetical protein